MQVNLIRHLALAIILINGIGSTFKNIDTLSTKLEIRPAVHNQQKRTFDHRFFLRMDKSLQITN